MAVMFYLFAEHHVLPGVYHRLPAGEKVMIRAFYEKEMEGRPPK